MTPTKSAPQPKIYPQACRQYGLPEPAPEYQFHKNRKWRIDWYFEHGNRRVALEVEGGVYTNGRHTRAAGFLKDMEKYNALSEAGIFLLRCTPDELMTTKIFELVKRVLYRKD